MIYEHLKYLYKYVTEEQFSKINKFLEILSPDMEEKRYEIDGESIFAKVMSYQTFTKQNCKIEAHNKYIDIQSSLVGAEGIDIFDRNILNILKEYDEVNDVFFFEEIASPFVSVKNVEGYFTMIFPQEAHRPQILINKKCSYVKKFVIKILYNENLF